MIVKNLQVFQKKTPGHRKTNLIKSHHWRKISQISQPVGCLTWAIVSWLRWCSSRLVESLEVLVQTKYPAFGQVEWQSIWKFSKLNTLWYLRGDIVITSFLRSSRNKSYMCSSTSGPKKNTEAVWVEVAWTVGKASLLLNFKFIEEEFGQNVGRNMSTFLWCQRK